MYIYIYLYTLWYIVGYAVLSSWYFHCIPHRLVIPSTWVGHFLFLTHRPCLVGGCPPKALASLWSRWCSRPQSTPGPTSPHDGHGTRMAAGVVPKNGSLWEVKIAMENGWTWVNMAHLSRWFIYSKKAEARKQTVSPYQRNDPTDRCINTNAAEWSWKMSFPSFVFRVELCIY